MFAGFKVESQIFYRTRLSCALVNLKPIVPGHVLVIPRRVVPRFAQLTTDEVSDLFLAAQHVSSVLARAYASTGATISMQDGPVAGQSVPHVHVHILPRKEGDLPENDAIYQQMDEASDQLEETWRHTLQNRPKLGGVDDESRHARSLKEMEEEAAWLSTFFSATDATTSVQG